MERVLLLCPEFMGYDKIINNELKRKYDVVYVDTEQYLSPLRETYKKLSGVQKAFYKLFKKRRERYRENLLKENEAILKQTLENLTDIDLLLVVNGDAPSNDAYEVIRRNNPKTKFILYIWDDIDWLFKIEHIKMFDEIYSYNIEDCKKYGFKYLPVFTGYENGKTNVEKKYDIAIIATASKNRIDFAKKIYEKYNDKYLLYIYFYSRNKEFDFFTHATPLSYEEYMNVVAQSRSIFEMGRFNQRGPTTRVFDALAVKTKIITTNRRIKKYPVYGENILVVDKKIDIPKSFIMDPCLDMKEDTWPIEKWIAFILG